MPDRVLAPQRGRDSIGPVLRRWLLVIFVAERVRLLSSPCALRRDVCAQR
jgi:hypothetical protein